MAGKTGLNLQTTDEEIDQMRVGTLTRHLREKFHMTEDETELLVEAEASAELKEKMSAVRKKAATGRRAGQAAENLRKILKAHNSKRRCIAELCHDIAVYFPSLDKSIKDNLKKRFHRKAEDILRDVQIQLYKEECPILVAGETSSGKSTFLNLLLGDNILPVAHLSSTSTICEVKYGETKHAVVHLREPSEGKQGQREVTIPLDGTEKHQKELESHIHVKGASRDSLPPAERVEIFWPLPLLQGGIVLVDSPGVGESAIMDKVVAEYIPKCFAFLYIIDSSRAGGVQQDRSGRLLQLYAKKDNSEDFNPESAMFICNKWETVLAKSPEEQDEVKSETLRKLSEMWPGLEESQVFFVSTKEAVGPFEILSEDFTKVLDGLDLLLPKSLDIKLDTQYRLLTRILSAALTPINSVLNLARQNLDRDTKLKMFQEALKHLQSFQEERDMRMEKLKRLMNSNMKSTEDALSSLVESGQLKEDILNAAFGFSLRRPFYTKLWYNNILFMLKNEKKQLGDEDYNFPNLKQLYSAVVDDMAHCPSFNMNVTSTECCFERAIKEAVESFENAHRETMHACRCDHGVIEQMDVRNFLSHGLSFRERLVALWKGLGSTIILKKFILQFWGMVFGSRIAVPILFDYWFEAPEGTPLVDILMQALSSSDKLVLITEMAERQMQPQRDLMAVLEEDITKMRMIMEQTIDHTYKDTRSNEEIMKTYQPKSMDINSFLGQLAMFHLTEMRKYEYDLDSITGWKDTRNKIGGGSFGEVYQVQVPYKEAETPAALKLGIMPYEIITTETACDFLKEEDNLGKLKGDHIVEYYGTACTKVEGGLRLGLVMELCEGTLESRIIGNRDRNPAWWVTDPEKQAAAFSYTQNLAVQLCEGLRTIHDAGYIHRDLKLINILVSKDDTVKLADFGLTKREDKITGTIAGTPLYAAPEVKERKVYNKSADIYSLGLILWEMWYGTTLYRLKDDEYLKMIEEDLKEGRDIWMPQWPETISPIPEWTRLIHDCLKKDPKKRPKIQECLDRISAMHVETGH